MATVEMDRVEAEFWKNSTERIVGLLSNPKQAEDIQRDIAAFQSSNAARYPEVVRIRESLGQKVSLEVSESAATLLNRYPGILAGMMQVIAFKNVAATVKFVRVGLYE